MKIKEIVIESAAMGNCFRNSYQYLTARPNENLILLHGWVTGTGGSAAGKRYEHAWIERIESDPQIAGFENLTPEMKRLAVRTAIDLTTPDRVLNPLEMPAIVYRGIGHIEVVKEFTYKQAIREALKYKHYGPWF